MARLMDLLEAAIAMATFRTDAGRTLSPEQLRQGVLDAHWGAAIRKEALSARAHVADGDFNLLLEHLQGCLKAYVNPETEKVGHSFRVVGDQGGTVTGTEDSGTVIQAASEIEVVAKGLVRVAAISGAEIAERLFDEWVSGGPFRFRICLVLDGVYVGGPLELDVGLRAYALPVSSEGFPISMPQVDVSQVVNLLGHCVLEVDASTSPAFFVPPTGDGAFPGSDTVTVLGGVPVDMFLTALSLVCNRSVRIGWRWTDYGEAAGFAVGSPGGVSHQGPARLRQLGRGWTHRLEDNIMELTDYRLPVANLHASRLWRAWELLPELHRRVNEDSRFRIAANRWTQSRLRDASPEDRAVDLRIALESLYLDSSGGELGFRLATTGARHLGVGLEERKRIRRELVDFYGVASRVIHGAEVESMNAQDQSRVMAASKLCRDAILKIVETKFRPDWSDLLLSYFDTNWRLLSRA